MRRDVRKAHGLAAADSRQQRCPKHDEQNDGHHFDHGEPVFKTAEAAHAARIDVQQRAGEAENPQPFRGIGKPPLAIDRNGGGFPADGDALRRPVGVTYREPGPGVQVDLRIHAERPGGRMRHRHLRKRAHQQQGNHRANEVAGDHGRTSRVDGERTAQKQARPDGAPDGDHGELLRAELAGQLLPLLDAAAHSRTIKSRFSPSAWSAVSTSSMVL